MYKSSEEPYCQRLLFMLGGFQTTTSILGQMMCISKTIYILRVKFSVPCQQNGCTSLTSTKLMTLHLIMIPLKYPVTIDSQQGDKLSMRPSKSGRNPSNRAKHWGHSSPHSQLVCESPNVSSLCRASYGISNIIWGHSARSKENDSKYFNSRGMISD